MSVVEHQRTTRKDEVFQKQHTAVVHAKIAKSASNNSLESEASVTIEQDEIEETVENAPTTTNNEDSAGKFQAILGLLRKMIGVKDIVGMRISLPAQLLDPISNLEYWTYIDRPDFFAVMSDPDDPVERMVSVVRWYLSKDLKFTKNKLVKSYNSILGEQFLAHFDVTPAPPVYSGIRVPSKMPSEGEEKLHVDISIEQVSHHPPVSVYSYECPEKGILARGVDHICAKFTGTAVRVAPGDENRGIYIVMSKRDNEEYACTHPTAYINGWLRGSLYITISEIAVITCEKTGLQAVLEYKEDKSWFSKAKHAVEVRIFRLKGSPPPIESLEEFGKRSQCKKKSRSKESVLSTSRKNSTMSLHNPTWTRHLGGTDMQSAYVKEREGEVLVTVTGSWRGDMTVQKVGQKPTPFLDMQNLEVVPKQVRPLEEQNPQESRWIWREVSDAITRKEFSKATKLKHALEDEQREKAHKRKEQGTEFVSQLFLPQDQWGRPGVPVLRKEVEEKRSYLPKEVLDNSLSDDGVIKEVKVGNDGRTVVELVGAV